jgi:glycerol kinase
VPRQRLVELTGLLAWRPEEHEATARGLAWLLAERSPHWQSVGATHFSPASNPMLGERYRRWREEMDRAAR